MQVPIKMATDRLRRRTTQQENIIGKFQKDLRELVEQAAQNDADTTDAASLKGLTRNMSRAALGPVFHSV